MKSKVVLIPCSSYEEETLYRCLKQGLELLGGLESLIKKNEKVLFKPNLVRSAKRERAVVTDPAVMENVFRIFREQGYEHLACGDSCGIGSAGKAMKECYMDAAVEKYGVELKEFQDEQRVETQRGRTLTLAKDVPEADALVSVCKMKTHALERVTGAVKNQYGCICGMHKAMGHTQYPNADIFARMLADLNLIVKPRLYIMDGITAMEGNGPTSGDPIPMNVLLFSEDPVALDTVFCHLIYLDPELVPTNVHGEKMGLGTWKSSQIDVVTPEGTFTPEQIGERYGNREFHVDRKKVKGKTIMDTFRVFGIFRKKPYIVKDQCRKCGICVSACPVEGKAIRFKNGRTNPPVYDYKKCIRCFCCQEMCPHRAIKVK